MTTRLRTSHWDSDTTSPILEVTCGQLLAQAAERSPEKVALVVGAAEPERRRSLNYAELYAAARDVASALLAVAEPGEHVAVWAPNSAEWVVFQHGASLAGTPLVTVNPAFRKDEAAYALEHSEAVFLVHAGSFREHDISATVAEIAPGLSRLRGTLQIDELAGFAAGATAGDLPVVDPDDAALVLFTSGTTGSPKPAVLRHRAVTNNARLCAERARFVGGTWLSPLPLFHVGGCVNAVMGPLWTHGTLVLLEAFDPGVLLAVAEATRPNLLGSVPTMILALMEHPSFDPSKLASIETILSGGSTVPIDLCRRIESALDARFSIVYGQTESTSVISQVRPEDSEEDKARSIGQPLAQVECKVVDPESGETIPIGSTGELLVRGYQTMIGYFGNPSATAETLDEDGWLHTGDLVSMDERGYMRVVGRVKDLIIRGGENIWPREVEDVLGGHPGVAEIAVLGIPDPKWGETVAAVIRPVSPDAVPTADELDRWSREKMAGHKVPSSWYQVDAFPMTASGKIQRFRLGEEIEAESLTPLPIEDGAGKDGGGEDSAGR